MASHVKRLEIYSKGREAKIMTMEKQPSTDSPTLPKDTKNTGPSKAGGQAESKGVMDKPVSDPSADETNETTRVGGSAESKGI